jgi:hypothetical protein
MSSALIAAGIFAVIAALYVVINFANKATPKPEGCTLDVSSCSSCTSEGCGLR